MKINEPGWWGRSNGAHLYDDADMRVATDDDYIRLVPLPDRAALIEVIGRQVKTQAKFAIPAHLADADLADALLAFLKGEQ